MKNIILLLISALALLSSCIEDDSSIMHVDIGDVTISGIAKEYFAVVREPFKIDPIIELEGIAESDLKYYWVYGSNGEDTLSTERVLDILMPDYIGSKTYITLIVENARYKTKYESESAVVTIGSHFEKGWVLLSDKGENSYLSFISESNTESPVYHDLYANISDQPMKKGKQLFIDTRSSDTYIGVIPEDAPEETFLIEGDYFTYSHLLSEEFRNFDNLDGEFKPNAVFIPGYGPRFVMTNKKIYPRSGSTYDLDKYSVPTYGDYEVRDLFGSTDYLGRNLVAYDYKNKQYVFVGDYGGSRNISTFSSPDGDFDLSNPIEEPLWMGSSSMLSYYLDNECLSVVKDASGQYKLHQIMVENTRVNDVWGLYLRSGYPIESDLPVTINENTVFCGTNGFLYIGNDKDIKERDLVRNGITRDLVTMPHPVTCIAPFTSTSIAVATNSGDPELPGDFYIISIDPANPGEILQKYERVGGIIKHMKYKNL
ncbi:PKD-like family lipoprotein [Marinifilum sp.]|uniref:PKD-like family lipoprotein n=1 Tax=Marinifilum sp. TaxID=2033137 RepID=UPI003BABBFFB